MIAQQVSRAQRSGAPFTILGLILAALGFGAVVLFTTVGGSVKSGSPAAVAEQTVVVAARDVPIRTQLAAEDITLAKFRASDIAPGSFAKLDDAKNLIAAIDLKKGQLITSNLLVRSSDTVIGPQAAYLTIPSGWVALTLPTGEQQGVGGYIQAGDYISILAQVQGRSGQNVRTLFTNVHVLRVGPATSDVTPVQGSASSPPKAGGISSSITVVVTQCQAEYLNWFIANGGIRYTLESYKDYRPQDVGVDATCPNVLAARGVTRDDIAGRWAGIFN